MSGTCANRISYVQNIVQTWCKTWCKHSTKHCTNIVQNIVQNIVAGDMVIQLTSLVLCISVIITRDIKLTSLVIYHISYSHITRDKLRYTTDLSCVADLVTDNQIECLFLQHGLHKIYLKFKSIKPKDIIKNLCAQKQQLLWSPSSYCVITFNPICLTSKYPNLFTSA